MINKKSGGMNMSIKKLVTAALTLVLVVLVTAACTTADKNKLNGMENEPKNAEEAVAMHKELMAQEEIDGGLIGGASLKADAFAAIVNYDK